MSNEEKLPKESKESGEWEDKFRWFTLIGAVISLGMAITLFIKMVIETFFVKR